MSYSFKSEKTINCPQCGDSLPLYFKHAKLVKCRSCKSAIFLEDDAVKLAGESSVLSEEPSIIELNTPFRYDKKVFLPVGKIRYGYGRGFWEEWWLKDTQNREYWLSVDEGDLALEQKIDATISLELFKKLYVGLSTQSGWMVTELGSAKCEGFEGALPKDIKIGSVYKYAHLSGKGAKLKTLEADEKRVEVYEGKWISPFDIKKVFNG